MNVTEFLHKNAKRTEDALDGYLASWEEVPERLVEAVRYSLFAGGKRLRPTLSLGAAGLIAGDDACALPAACAIEMIHTYSLIHDDLPAMDNDDLRRGRPTCHKAFGEATAILAGDALLTMAFDVLGAAGNAEVIREVAQAAGATGMVGGQLLDMEAEGRAIDLDDLRRIHAFKTGALIRAAVRSGALLADAGAAPLEALTRYAEHIGLAFQIADDILDVVGDEKALGKRVGGDADHEKATYPALAGIDLARKLAADAVDKAIEALAPFGPEADTFRELARYIIARDR